MTKKCFIHKLILIEQNFIIHSKIIYKGNYYYGVTQNCTHI